MSEIISSVQDAKRYKGEKEVDGTRLNTATLVAIYKDRKDTDLINIVEE